ncbi:DUF3570 domain-containing protein [Sandaracinus amylolyticus]|uniref:DUF3570 domain-containing protein n=1 Tax=Sandaracinus amylolyticus TaxID=927083 RepID=UPI0012ED252E|nr:DUF3570 domain-containing protein [Sandaracinus amylolyticus]
MRGSVSAALLVVLLAVPGVASSQDDEGLRFERFEARFATFVQRGAGWQSQASDDPRAPGSEALEVYQPALYARLREGRETVHEITVPIDVVTSASADALDAVSTASLVNEAVGLHVAHRFALDADTRVTARWGGNVEETLRSGTVGLSIARELAEDNATLVVSADVIADHLDRILPNGSTPEERGRVAATFNVSLAQLLSPTTMIELAGGATLQAGELATTWGSVPTLAGGRAAEVLPDTRARYAVRATLRQAVLETMTFGEAAYRLYADDLGVVAHTGELGITQYVIPGTLWIRADARVHTQTAPWLWTSLLQDDGAPGPRTADSDLAELVAIEGGGALRWIYDRGSWLELEGAHYVRTNGLDVTRVALTWGQAF